MQEEKLNEKKQEKDIMVVKWREKETTETAGTKTVLLFFTFSQDPYVQRTLHSLFLNGARRTKERNPVGQRRPLLCLLDLPLRIMD